MFNEPDKSPASRLVWEYYDADTDRWTLPVEINATPDGVFQIPIAHFSAYRATVIGYGGLSQGGQ
jgi:hypothetical protein